MRYDGGKGAMGVAQWIINQIPPHRVYIEPFLGGGAGLRKIVPGPQFDCTSIAPRHSWRWDIFPIEISALHDYRYLGSNFRERERIKRKKNRWARRLAAMPILERRLLVATLAETDAARSIIVENCGVGRVGAPTSTIASLHVPTSAAAAGGIAGNGDVSGCGRYRRNRRETPAVIAGNSDDFRSSLP